MDSKLYQMMQDLIEVEKELEELRLIELELRKQWNWHTSVAFVKGDHAISEYGDNSQARREKNSELTQLKASIIMRVRELYLKENR